VTLDYLVEESPDLDPSQQLVMLTQEEIVILKIVRRLGSSGAIDRLLNVLPAPHAGEPRGPAPLTGGRGRTESARFDTAREDLSEA
jgi:hypothetical protein